MLRKQGTTVVLVGNSSESSSELPPNDVDTVTIAQFFEAVDRVVILGDGGVKEQGPWRDLKRKGTAIEKFIPSHEGQPSGSDIPTADLAKLSAQLRARDEAAVDLARQTGDITLYGTCLASRFKTVQGMSVLT